jgi:hypothetical protein
MKSIQYLLILGFALYSQTTVNAQWSIPDQLEFEVASPSGLPKITPQGSLPEKLEWRAYTDDGTPVPFEILGNSFVLLAAKPGLYRTFVWKSGSPGETKQCVIVLKGGDHPEPDLPGNEGPYPDLVIEVTKALNLDNSDESLRRRDALTLFAFYGIMAERVLRDGERQTPKYTTITEISVSLKELEKTILEGSNLPSISTKYPNFAKVAADKFRSIFGSGPSGGDSLTPEKRNEYINFLRSISLGSANAAWGG